jgi:thiol-disulfide isomerase/thioredoxin
MSSPVIKLNGIKSNDELLKHLNKHAKGKLSVLLFSADWCNPCEKIKKEIYTKGAPNELSVKYEDDVVFFIIDIEENKQLAEEYNITSIPCFQFLICTGKDVEFVCKKISGGDKNKIVKVIEEYISSH